MEARAVRRRIGIAIGVLMVVVGGGTFGYWALGLTPVQALFQTVTTVSTVGFRPLFRFTGAAEIFTIVLVLLGVGSVLYAFGVVLEALVEGHLFNLWEKRRMERKISDLKDHVIVCGWGRIGRSVAANLVAAGRDFVVVDQTADRLASSPHLNLVGDATDDEVLRQAGIERAAALIATTSTDTTNLYLTLSGRELNPHLFIVARAQMRDSEPKMFRAGADRVVNPQAIGGARMVALVLQPHVAEFLDVITRSGQVEFRLSEVQMAERSPLVGRSLRDAQVLEQTGAQVLGLRAVDGRFTVNPGPETVLSAGEVLIVVGTMTEIEALLALAEPSEDGSTDRSGSTAVAREASSPGAP
jgi:voltage-gated potassium channel